MVNECGIRRKSCIWKALILLISYLFEVVNSMDSSPYNKIESKTRIFHLMMVRALSQNTFNLLHTAIAAANLFSTSH